MVPFIYEQIRGLYFLTFIENIPEHISKQQLKCYNQAL